jgi:hypothetical protein
MHSCRFKGTRLLADNPNSRCHFYFWRPAIVITVHAKLLDSLWPPAIICAPKKGREAEFARVVAFGLFFLNCLEIFDAVVSPKEFFDRR